MNLGTYSQGVAPYYDLFAAMGDPPDGAATFLGALVPRGASVLDIGAGTGATAIALAERNLQVTALEPDPEMYAVLLTRLAGRFDIDSRITPVPMGAGFRTGTRYDCCSCFSVLHLLAPADQEALVGYAAAQVKAGGSVVLGFPAEAVSRSARPWTMDSTRKLGRLRVEHHSSLEPVSVGAWQTHWRFLVYLDDEQVHEVNRTFEWRPLGQERLEELMRMNDLKVVGDFAGFDRQPFARGESRARVVVARPG